MNELDVNAADDAAQDFAKKALQCGYNTVGYRMTSKDGGTCTVVFTKKIPWWNLIKRIQIACAL